jgi:hypothetical protein
LRRIRCITNNFIDPLTGFNSSISRCRQLEQMGD